MNLSALFIRRPVATTLLMAALALLGIAAFPLLPTAPLPQVDFPTIQVTATLAGASAETMASSVATPLERQLGEIAGVTQMTSFSAQGATSVTLQFALDRSIDAAAQDVQAAITAAGKNLPRSMTEPPTYKKLDPADAPILVLSARSDTLPLTTVDEYADSYLAQRISQVAGVAQVALGGAQEPSIRVQVDPAKLAARGLTLEDIRPVLANATTDAAKGTLDTGKISFTIAANDQITEAKNFDDVVLAYRNGAPVRVSDVGRAVSAAADRTATAYDNGKPAILLTVYKQPGANVIATADRIKAQLPRLSADIPPAITIHTVLDRTTTIRASVHDVEFTLILVIGLVVMVVLLFLRSLWGTLIAGSTVLLALLGAFAAMYVLGFSLDNLSLMALTIAVGFVVDDAIVVVENITRHGESGEPPFEAALQGLREIAFTVLSISTSLVAVFIPLLLMGGLIGRLFREFALTVIAAIAVSALVSLTLAPMLCSRFVRYRGPKEHGCLERALEAGLNALLSAYRGTLDSVLRHRAVTLCVFFATIALAVVMAIQIPKGFFPIQDTGLIGGLAQAAQQTSPEEMKRLERVVGSVVLKDPGVADVTSWTGSTGGNGFAQTANTARFYIVLKPRDERTHTASQIIDRLRPEIAKVEGVKLFLSPTQDITVGGRTSRGSFQYTLEDANLPELITWSQKMLDKMRTLPELADVSTDLLADAPLLTIAINRDQAARFGISPQAIDDTLNDAYGQRQITQYFTALNTYPVILEITPSLQHTLASLDRLYVQSPLTGAAVPLASLVGVDTTRVGPLSITHQGQFPAVTLSFNLQSGVALGQAVDAINRATREINLPGSVVGAFQGNARAFQTSLESMPVLILAALAAIYVILGVLYESFIHPLTILSTLPSAGVGALLALRLGHMELTVIGIVAIILLIGIVQKNGILLVDFALVAERERGLAPIDAIREACLLRFRPILMTTAATLFAGVPLALGTDTGSELRQPLGYAMIGGLALSQLLTLYTTPVIYLYLDRLQRGPRRRTRTAIGGSGKAFAAKVD